jgi:hypothetical protein
VQGTIGAGIRGSASGPAHDPGAEYWAHVGQEMASRFEGATPETIWIVGSLRDEGTLLNFPVSGAHPLIQGAEEDGNEATLDLFDSSGFRVWLQPGIVLETRSGTDQKPVHLSQGRITLNEKATVAPPSSVAYYEALKV